MDTIYFGNDALYYARVETNKKELTVTESFCYKLAQGSIINGVITNMHSCKSMLKQLCDERNVKKVNICIDSTSVVSKVKKLPATSEKNIMNMLRTEFVDVSNTMEEPMYDYSTLRQAGKNQDNKETLNSILMLCTDKKFVKTYIELFEGLEVKLESVDVGVNAITKLCDYEKLGLEDTYVFTLIDGANIVLYLFVNGEYFFTSRGRLIAQSGTEEYRNEIVQRISQINQFNKAQRMLYNIENVYVSNLEQSDFIACKGLVEVIGLKLLPYKISEAVKSVNLGSDSEKYIYNIGTVLQRGGNC